MVDKEEDAVVPTLEDDSIRSRILTIRGVQVMLDRDLAESSLTRIAFCRQSHAGADTIGYGMISFSDDMICA